MNLPGEKKVGTKDQSVIDSAIEYINSELSNLDPPIEYESVITPTNIKYNIYDKEFILSSYFIQWLVTIQADYLWPKNIYNVIFLYESKAE